jgi:putative transposase
MARSLRLEVPDGIFHVTSRGWERRPLFAADADRFTFLSLVERTLARYAWSCLTYCLMDNHFHLVVRTPQANLSRGMQNLNTRYATAFNRRYDRVGSLFDRRYRATLVQRDAHLLEVLRYVALNPVRAERCSHPSAWPWSAHREIAGQAEPGFVAVEEVRSYFNGTDYADFVADAPGVSPQPSGVVLGDRAFVREAIDLARPHSEIPRAHWGAGRPELAQILADTEGDAGIARAYRTHGYTMASIAEELGCHLSTVSRRLKRYEESECSNARYDPS